MFSSKPKRVLVLLFAVSAIVCSQYFCSSKPEEKPAPANDPTPTASATDNVAKGKYLVNGGGCNDCHSPKLMTAMGPVPDSTKLLSGYPADAKLPALPAYDATKPGNWMLFSPDLTAAVGPWGISFAANLTPDSTTGLGAWTEANFINAMRKGKHLGLDGGRPILPPMPWTSLAAMTDEDLKLIFTYLQSIPAIQNQVPQPVPPPMVGK